MPEMGAFWLCEIPVSDLLRSEASNYTRDIGNRAKEALCKEKRTSSDDVRLLIYVLSFGDSPTSLRQGK